MKRAVGVFELLAEEIRVRCRVVNPVLDAHNPGSVFWVSGAGFQGQGSGFREAGFRQRRFQGSVGVFANGAAVDSTHSLLPIALNPLTRTMTRHRTVNPTPKT